MSERESQSEKNFTPPRSTPDYLVRQGAPPAPDNVWDRLLEMALALDDALQCRTDRVEYVGSIELAEQFRAAVTEAHHARFG